MIEKDICTVTIVCRYVDAERILLDATTLVTPDVKSIIYFDLSSVQVGSRVLCSFRST